MVFTETTTVYKNESRESLQDILQKAKEDNQLYWFEIYSEIENRLYCFKITNGFVDKEYIDTYNELCEKYKDYIIEKYAITKCNFQAMITNDPANSVELKDSQLDLILNLISYAQSNKDEFQRYLHVILAKDYSKEEIKNMIDELRKIINLNKYK